MLHTNKRRKINNSQKFILLGLLNILSVTKVSNSAPLNNNQSRLDLEQLDSSLSLSSLPSSTSSPTLLSKKKTADWNSEPDDHAWQTWLRSDSNPERLTDPAHARRRITPKSIFIVETPCPEGYTLDDKERCINNVNYDEDAHTKFLTDHLNKMYGNQNASASKSQLELSLSSGSASSSSQATGPIQFSIPFIIDTSNSENINVNEPEKISQTFTAPLEKNIKDEPLTLQDDDTVVTLYEVKDTIQQGDKEIKDEIFFRIENRSDEVVSRNDNIATNGKKIVPIVEFIRETNSNITNIVDSNIPVIPQSQILNHTVFTNINHEINDDTNVNNGEIIDKYKILNESSISSMSVNLSKFLTSKISQDLVSTRNESDRVITALKNDTDNSSTVDETTSKILFNNNESSNEFKNIETTPIISADELDYILGDNDETTDYMEEHTEKYDDTTDQIEEDFETSTESEDEILKHSEAGLSVTMPVINLMSSLYSTNENKNNITSNISSSVTINNDFIRETTLVGLNVDKPEKISKDSEIKNKTITTDSTSEEKIVIITPKSQITTNTTPPSKEIDSIINLNNEESTESSTITRETTTEIPEDNLQTETTLPSTTEIDEIFITNSDNINPVVTIEEASMADGINREPPPSIPPEPSKISSSNRANSNQSESDVSDIMTASPSDTKKITLLSDEPSLALLLYNIHDTEHIRDSGPSSFDNKNKKNLSSSTLVNNDERLSNYDAISKHPPINHFYGINDHQPIIKTIDGQRFESNQKQYFFPNDFDTSADVTRDYVRFPSDEANSIHTPDGLKERYSHGPYILQNNRGSRLGVKQVNWHVPSELRSPHQSLPQLYKSNTNEQGVDDELPVSTNFWPNIPLVEDLNFPHRPTYASTIPVGTVKRHNNGRSRSSRILDLSQSYTARTFPHLTIRN